MNQEQRPQLAPDLNRLTLIEIVGALQRLHALHTADTEILQRLLQTINQRLDDLESRVAAIEADQQARHRL